MIGAGGVKSPFKKASAQRHRAWGQSADICRDYLAGSSQVGLAELYGCSPDTVHQILVANDVTLAPRPRGSNSLTNVANSAYDPPFDEGLIVFREPCPRCGTRADIGCRHDVTRLAITFGMGGHPVQQRTHQVTDRDCLTHKGGF